MAATIIYQCPNCGAGLTFDADKQKFCCEFCLSEFTESEVRSAENEAARQSAEEENRAFNEGMREYECPSCGAHVMADENTAADLCFYCHNPIVLVGRLDGQMKPNRIVPFKYDKETAKQKFLKYVSKKIFLPRGFSDPEQVEKISGVYYPFWVTDADTDSGLRAQATRSRSWRRGNVIYTETSNFDVTRRGNIHFEDITTSALSDADKRMLEGILPFPSEALQPFSMPFLSGFLAKKRNIEREALTGEVRGRMNEYAGSMLRGTIHGYQTVSVSNLDVNILKSNWEYALLPIWVLTYRDKRDRVYTYAMNGYTGKIYGELPVSFPKLSILFASVLAGLTAIFTLIGGFLA